MKIAFVASEVFPFAKTGGLADVAGALPVEIKKLGNEVKIFMPKYSIVDEQKFGLKYLYELGSINIRVAGRIHGVHLFKGTLPDTDVEIYFIDYPYFYHRDTVYTNDPDEDQRFILFVKAVIESLQRLSWTPDVIHCNDWQTALLPLYIKDNYSWDKMFSKTATVFTIHNVAYQGKFSTQTLFNAEIRGEYFYPGGPVEYYGDVNFMKAGIHFSDVINTVSETYSKELLTPEYSEGMHDALKLRLNDFYGILNGVDYKLWNPETDKHIPYNFSSDDLAGKLKNKKHLLEKINLNYNENLPLVGIVSRLAIQKGFDIIFDSLYELMDLPAQWVFLGNGEKKYEKMLTDVGAYFKNKVHVTIGYDNDFAHLIEAGTDIFLMPSRYEPCGLNQIYSLKYGTVPVVRKTGGLADTVQDWNEYNAYGQDTGTGFSFNNYSGAAMVHALSRAINDFHNKAVWKKIMLNGMKKDYSWEKSAVKYVDMYKNAIEIRRF